MEVATLRWTSMPLNLADLVLCSLICPFAGFVPVWHFGSGLPRT